MESTIKPMDSAKERNSFVNIFWMTRQKTHLALYTAGNIN
jgi:hypothetical protein